ncbi:MAG: hypothetical protein ACRD19_00080 [Terriglobia bacterium]
MRISRIICATGLLLAALAIAGCGHRLVATNSATTVNVYPDKASFDSLRSLESQGGTLGMLGGLASDIVVRKIAINTAVKVLSSDHEGDMIKVLKGPNQGLEGYVAKINVD